LAIAALSLLCASASTGATKPGDYAARAIQLLRSLYPGLKSAYPRGVHVEIEDGQDLFNRPVDDLDTIYPSEIHLYSSNLEPLNPQYSDHPEPILVSRFGFLGEGKGLRLLWVSGPFVDGRLGKLKKDLDKHPEWPDARVVEALKGAGAKFGPDDKAELMRALPLKELEPCTGRLEIVSAEFRVRLGPVEGEKPKANLTWRVLAKAYSPDGRYETDCSMTLEPFDGALMEYNILSVPRPVPRIHP
jgi:hypothetical protein